MFEKLLSVLPYNPSLVQQLSFYGKRMRREAVVRRTGVVFLLLAFFVQFFAFVSPPQPTLASSSNDIISGGITSAADAAAKCTSDTQDYKKILVAYGISCADLTKTSTVSLSSTANDKQLFSMGRLPYGATNTRTGKPTSETRIDVAGAGALYLRYLWSFDSGSNSTYQALKGTSSVGQKTFYILFNCGNPVFVGLPSPLPTAAPTPPPAPNFTVVKGVKAKSQNVYFKSIDAKQGDVVDFSIELINTGNTTLKNVNIKDALPAGLAAVPGSLASDGKQAAALLANFNTGALTPNQFRRVTFSATVGTPPAACSVFTNSVVATADSLPSKQDTAAVQACKPTVTPPPAPAPIPAPTPVPTATPTPVKPVVAPVPAPCVYNPNLPAASSECKPCDKSVSSADKLACLPRHKAAANVTQGLADANNTTAKASDKIVYTLYAENQGKATIEDFVFQENLSDVLDYADVTDLYGGTKDADNVISWPKMDVKPGQTVSVKLAVTVKSAIPVTPQVQGTGRYDHVMTNVYSNAININLPQPVTVQVQTAAATLPNTGPGTTLAIAASIVMVAAYFFARARLLSTETAIAIQDNNSGGF